MADSINFKGKLLSMQDNLLNFAIQLTNNRDAAQDLLQDTTLKALDNQKKFVENTNFKGWVFTIMRNIFINNYRRQVRSATVIDTTADLYHLNLSQESGVVGPEGVMSMKEIGIAINTFADEYRLPFKLYIAGYKYAEIADRMNLPLGTVKSRIFFARRKLQRILYDFRE